MFKRKKDILEDTEANQIDLSAVTSTMASLDRKKEELAANEGEMIRDIAGIEESFDILRLHAEELSDKIQGFRKRIQNITHRTDGMSSEQIVHEIYEEAEDLYTDVEKERSYYDELEERISALKGRVLEKNSVFEETDEILVHLDEVLATLEHKIQGK